MRDAEESTAGQRSWLERSEGDVRKGEAVPDAEVPGRVLLLKKQHAESSWGRKQPTKYETKEAVWDKKGSQDIACTTRKH